jgi:uncharacterized NAD(P)/FAD-binding protein YdhS
MDGSLHTGFAPRAGAAPYRSPLRIAIIGGGASGVIAAANLSRETHGETEIWLIERRREIGRGLAYAAGDPDHLLNVRASNMSAFADDPDHFLRWLEARASANGLDAPTRACFAPRMAYGDYVQDLLNAPAARTVTRLTNECVSVEETACGVRVYLHSQARLDVDLAILAIGHDVRRVPVGEVEALDAWDHAALSTIEPDAAVLIVGTGLTMVDVVVSLHGRGHRGPITAVSRRGLAPFGHSPFHGSVAPRVLSRESVPLGAPVSRLARWLRDDARVAEVESSDWRGAVDALRPHTRALWQAMSADQRRRFLRHARPWWDVHRHRMAPAVSEVIDKLRANGQLRIVAGRIETAVRVGGAVHVAVRRRGAAAADVLTAGHVIGCTGSPESPDRSRDPLIRALLREGVARPDPLGVSLDVTDAGALIDASGRPSRRLSAIGPPSRAALWEVIAVPDIRDQCASMVKRLARREDVSPASAPPRRSELHMARASHL